MSDHSWKVKRCGLPCCKPIDFLSGQEVLHIGHIEQGVSIPCSMWPIRPVSVRWRYRNRRMERRGMGAAWAAWAAWATARPISRRGAIGAIGGRRRRFFWRPSAIEVLGGGARVRILPHGRAQAVSRPGGARSGPGACDRRGRLPLKSRSGPFSGDFRRFRVLGGDRGALRRSCAHWRRRGPFCDPAPDRVLALAVGARPGGVSGGRKRV